MILKYKTYLLILITSVFFLSCANKKNVLFLQDIEQYTKNDDGSQNIIRIKKNDGIIINISSSDQKSAVPFNLPIVSNANNNQITNQATIQSYLVDNKGNIQFPIIGNIYVLNKSKEELRNDLVNRISTFVKLPIVNIRINNFKISVLGEVRKPGMYPIQNERVSIIDAISMAGGLSIYGKRREVLIIRENNNYEKTYYKMDLTSTDIFNSKFYYLQQNDVVIINPNKAQVQASIFNRNTPVYVSIVSLLISVLITISRL